MALDATALDIIHGVVPGAIIGFVSQRLAIRQIIARAKDESKVATVRKPLFTFLWVVLSAAVAALLFAIVDGPVQKVEYLVYIGAALNIMIVDVVIRKIPNSTLITIMATRAVSIIVQLFCGASFGELAFFSGIGLLVGFAVFLIPSVFHIPVGAGDIKLCAVIGFCIGLSGFAQSLVVMAAGEFILWIVLLITKRGTLKTMAPMGPFMAAGFIISLIIPLSKLIPEIAF